MKYPSLLSFVGRVRQACHWLRHIQSFKHAKLLLPLVAALAMIGCKADPLTREFKRIEAPAEFPPHPRLFLNQQEIDGLKARIARDAELRKYVDNFVAEMQKAASKPELPTEDKTRNGEVAVQANRFALAYVLSGDKKLAESAATILKAWIVLFPKYPEAPLKGRATDWPLGEVQWLARACSAYDLIYNAGVLTDAEKTALERDVFWVSGDVARRSNHGYRSNWRIAGTCAAAVAGFCIGDRELIDDSLNGLRDKNGKLVHDGFAQQMYWSVLRDGIYYERSGSYTNAILLFYTWMLEAARHSGVDLWHMKFDDDGYPYDFGADKSQTFKGTGPKTFDAYFDAYTRRLFGNGTMAKVGNDGSGRPLCEFVWAAAYRAYQDPRYAWVFNRVREKKPMDDPLDLMFIPPDIPAGELEFPADTQVGLSGKHINSCTLLPSGGFAILRQSGDANAAGVSVTFGDFTNAHGHPDQLSIATYADGLIMTPDPDTYGSGDPWHANWEKQTIAHNTVTVDEVSQYPQRASDDAWVDASEDKPVFGKLVFFHPGKQLKAVRVKTDNANDGVVLDRTIALVDSVVVDFYRCRSRRQHQYDFALHVDGELTKSEISFGKPQAAPLSSKIAYLLMTDVRRAAMPGKPVQLTYTAKAGQSMQVTLLPGSPAEVISAKDYPAKKGGHTNALILRKSGKNVDFVNAMSFPAAGVKNIRQLSELPRGLTGVRIERVNGVVDIVVSADKPGTYTVAGQTFTGQVALIRIANGSTALLDAGE